MISSNSIQLWVLIKHFVVRMFNNDVMTYERERREQVVIVLLLIAATGGYIARQLLLPYILSVFSGYTAATIWIETSTYLTVSMALTGIFSVVNWDNIFPDARDYGNLIPLP
ncbi:MAG: hypothetical protein GY765_17060, partial [bacterium]|nr:hypothetical protein [bacterium]